MAIQANMRILQGVYNDELHYLYDDNGGDSTDPTGGEATIILLVCLFGLWMSSMLIDKIADLKYYCSKHYGYPKLTLRQALSEFDFWKQLLVSIFYLCCVIISIVVIAISIMILIEH